MQLFGCMLSFILKSAFFSWKYKPFRNYWKQNMKKKTLNNLCCMNKLPEFNKINVFLPIWIIFTSIFWKLRYFQENNKIANTAWKVSMSVFGVSLVRIFPHSEWIRKDIPYLSVFSPNTVSKYGDTLPRRFWY